MASHAVDVHEARHDAREIRTMVDTLTRRVDEFLTRTEAVDKYKATQEKKKDHKLNWIIGLATVIVALLGIGWAVFVYERTNHTQIHFPEPHAEAYDASMAVE